MLTYLVLWISTLPARLAGAVLGRHAADLEDMPGHPERVAPMGDPAADETFGDLAEALLDDPEEPDLSDVNDRWGWTR